MLEKINNSNKYNINSQYSTLKTATANFKRQPYAKEDQNNIPKARKYGFGFLGAFVLLCLTKLILKKHNTPSLSECQKYFSEIFKKDVSDETARNMLKKYEEIFKIDDAKLFTEKAFNQIKKDYGFEKADLPLKINLIKVKSLCKDLLQGRKTLESGILNNINPSMTLNPICNNSGKLSNQMKKDIFETIYHEFKHLQQEQYCYYADKNKFFSILKQRIQKSFNIDSNLKQKMIQDLEINYDKCFKNVEIKDVKNQSLLIDKYMKNNANYKMPPEISLKEYKKQILEEEAFYAGDFGQKIGNMFLPVKFLDGYLTKGLGIATIGCFAKDSYDSFKAKDVRL